MQNSNYSEIIESAIKSSVTYCKSTSFLHSGHTTIWGAITLNSEIHFLQNVCLFKWNFKGNFFHIIYPQGKRYGSWKNITQIGHSRCFEIEDGWTNCTQVQSKLSFENSSIALKIFCRIYLFIDHHFCCLLR